MSAERFGRRQEQTSLCVPPLMGLEDLAISDDV